MTVTLAVTETDSSHTHSFVNTGKKKATCTQEGINEFTCKCGKKYEEKVAMSKGAGRKKKLDDEQILKLAKEGYSSKEIAEILDCSKSAVDHSDGWRARKQ